MAFESFDDLARVGLKRTAMKAARVVVKSEFSARQRPQTIFRFLGRSHRACGLGARGGQDRVDDRPLKFTAARGMPIANEASEATDVVVLGGELMFVLPDGVRLSASSGHCYALCMQDKIGRRHSSPVAHDETGPAAR
jgi:hypothetical protein